MEFQEEQRISVMWMRILFLIIIIGSLAGVLLGGMNSGHEPQISDYLGAVFCVAIVSLVYYMVFYTTLKTSVSMMGFAYEYFPFVWREKTITKEMIKSWQMQTMKSGFQYGGYGIKQSYFPKKTAFMMGSRNAVEFKLHDGKTLIFTTNNPEQLQLALRKYFSQTEIR